VINFSLRVGAVSEQVTVEANTIQVETTSGDLSGLIEGNQVTQLPLNGRNFMQLVTLVPGCLHRRRLQRASQRAEGWFGHLYQRWRRERQPVARRRRT